MDDLFSDDGLDKSYERNERRSLLSSIAMLVILSTLVITVLLPSLPKETTANTPYRTQAVVTEMTKENNKYIATVKVVDDSGTIYYHSELTKQEFVKYKENQDVQVEIVGNRCRIVR